MFVYDFMFYYKGNQLGEIFGIFFGFFIEYKGDYYWWEGGVMMGIYVDYWFLIGDEFYNKVVIEGMIYQVGFNEDYMLFNYMVLLGNDDQGFWGMSVMLVVENKFFNLLEDQFQWFVLVQVVFYI